MGQRNRREEIVTTLRRRLSTAEFTRRFVKFDGKEIDPSAEWPWIAEPLEYMDRIRGAIFLMRASVQSYKSTAAELFNARQIALNAGRAIWYFPTDQACKDFAQEKWKKLIDACPAIQRVLYDSPHKNTTLALDLPFGHFRMCSANVEMNRNSKSGRDITCDEAWEYKPGWLADIRKRYTSFEENQSYRLIIPTSGENVGSEVNEIWNESDQRTWHNRCLDCHRDFVPEYRFRHELEKPGGLRFDRTEKVFHTDGTINTVAFAATVRLQCPHCLAQFAHTPALQRRLNSPAHGARHLPLNPTPKPRVHAWNWNAFVNVGWIALAEEQLKAELAQDRGDLTQIELVARKRAAIAYSEAAFIQIKTGTDDERGAYKLGERHRPRITIVEPADVTRIPTVDAFPPAFTTLTIDVQQNHYWYLVRDWWPDLVSQLVTYGKALSSGYLREVQQQYKIKDHGGNIVFDEQANQFVMPDGCGVYLDGNYNPAQVRRLAASYNWCVFRGDDCKEFRHKDGFYRIYDEVRVIDAFEGTLQQGARYVPEIRFANTPARNRFAVIRSIGGQQKRVWTFAADADEIYKNHLNAWARLEKKSPKSNETIYEWKQTAARDDLFWCEKASVVVASMAGLIGVSDGAKAEEQPEENSQQL
jgi:hypothetical protein